MFISAANAMGLQPDAAGGAAGGSMSFLVTLGLMFAIFYFLLIRPQQKRAKQQKAMLEALKKGDHVLTTGGLMGRIVEVEGDILTVDLGECKIRTPRGFINTTFDPKALDKVAHQAPEADKK